MHRINASNLFILSRGVLLTFSERYLSKESNVMRPAVARKPNLPVPTEYFVTTPIYYVNAVPHIGHLYTSVLADTVSRWYTILGVPVLFSTGSDEHGLKIQQAAAAQGKPPEIFCNEVSQKFKNLFELSNIRYSDFIRTTERRHCHAVHEMWETLLRNGFIYKGTYEGWYSVPDEAFLTDDQVTEAIGKNGDTVRVSKESGHAVEWVKEDNYMFRLSQCSKSLSNWLDKSVIHPSKFEPLVRQYISTGLPDLSVSRSRARIPWGIPVPGDDTQTIYVWLDALVNYLTVSGYPENGGRSHWPADCHIVGKDILRFHAVYWPAFLIAAGLDPPRRIQCHSHWLINKEKMSKSKGNVVDPLDRLARYSPDGLRYYLMKDGVPDSDGNYTDERALECINSDLVNTLGNLLSRCTARAVNRDQIFPAFNADLFNCDASSEERDMMESLASLPDLVDAHYRDFKTNRALDQIMIQLYRTNAFVQSRKPWELVRSAASSAALNNVLCVAMETLRVCTLLLQPVVPTLADRTLTRLGEPKSRRTFADMGERGWKTSQPLGQDIGPLIPRIK